MVPNKGFLTEMYVYLFPAYFEEAPHAAFGIVHRHWFEARLKAHMEGSGDDDSDSSWYAIRNIIYASGCRIELSKQKSFREANQIAWGWFENALSVHSEILYFRTSLLAVQALTLMVCDILSQYTRG
jgi:hypothetical protein